MSLRIHRPIPAGHAPLRADGAAPADQGDSWISRLVKMIPAEAIAIYSTMIPHVTDSGGGYRFGVVACIALAAALVIRWFATIEPGNRKPEPFPMLVASLSFGLWLATLPAAQSPFAVPREWQFLPLALGLAWVVVAPAFYKGEPARQQQAQGRPEHGIV